MQFLLYFTLASSSSKSEHEFFLMSISQIMGWARESRKTKLLPSLSLLIVLSFFEQKRDSSFQSGLTFASNFIRWLRVKIRAQCLGNAQYWCEGFLMTHLLTSEGSTFLICIFLIFFVFCLLTFQSQCREVCHTAAEKVLGGGNSVGSGLHSDQSRVSFDF